MRLNYTAIRRLKTLFILLAVLPLLLAAGPSEIQRYLGGEHGLACIAIESGAPIEQVVLAKMEYDRQYGIANGFTEDGQWEASYGSRMMGFAALLGVSGPLADDGGYTTDCANKINALFWLNKLSGWGDEYASQ